MLLLSSFFGTPKETFDYLTCYFRVRRITIRGFDQTTPQLFIKQAYLHSTSKLPHQESLSQFASLLGKVFLNLSSFEGTSNLTLNTRLFIFFSCTRLLRSISSIFFSSFSCQVKTFFVHFMFKVFKRPHLAECFTLGIIFFPHKLG